MFGGSQRARSRLRVPWGISPLIQSKPAGSVLAFHLATVSQVLWLLLSLWGWWCSRALTIPVLQILCMPVLTTRGIAQEFQKVNLCQDSKISILPSVCGCFFTTSLPLAFFWWNCLSFKSLVLSPASMFLLCNHYRAYISTPDSPWPHEYQCLGPTPRQITNLDGVVHMHWDNLEEFLFARHKSLQPYYVAVGLTKCQHLASKWIILIILYEVEMNSG